MRRCVIAMGLLLSSLLTAPARAQGNAPGFLGIAISEPARMDDATAQGYFGARTAEEFLKAWRLRVEDQGALALSVLPGCAADQYGVISGDLVVAVNGMAVTNAGQFQRLIGAMRPGTAVELALLRAGREKKIVARLGSRPAEYPLGLEAMPAPEATEIAPPPDLMPSLVTPEEAAKALGDDFGPEPAAAVPDYDAAVKLYRESRVAQAEGLLLAGPIALGEGNAVVANAGDEVVRLGGKPIATPMGFAFEILRHKDAGDFPLTLDVCGADMPEGQVRTIRIENARDADRAAAARFFTDEDLVHFWLFDLLPQHSAKNKPDANGPVDRSGQDKDNRGGVFSPFPWNPPPPFDPARLQPRQLLECVVAARALRLTKLAEDAAAFLAAAYPGSQEAAALDAHDRPIQLAAWHARLRDRAAAGDIRLAVEAARALLGEDPRGLYGREAKKFMDCVNAAAGVRIARAEKLLDAGDVAGARQETALVARAVPEDARLAALLGRCDATGTLQAGRRALDEGQLRRARLMAEAALARDSSGAEAKPAQQLLDDVRSSAKSRTDRANRLLDAGDAASARDELAPVLEAFPDDPAAIAAWNRSRPPGKKIPPEK